MEVLICNESARLLSNIMIYYNVFMLSEIVKIKENQGDLKAMDFLKRVSPIACQHVNLLGMYDFSLAHTVDVDKLLSKMVELLDFELSKIKT